MGTMMIAVLAVLLFVVPGETFDGIMAWGHQLPATIKVMMVLLIIGFAHIYSKFSKQAS